MDHPPSGYDFVFPSSAEAKVFANMIAKEKAIQPYLARLDQFVEFRVMMMAELKSVPEIPILVLQKALGKVRVLVALEGPMESVDWLFKHAVWTKGLVKFILCTDDGFSREVRKLIAERGLTEKAAEKLEMATRRKKAGRRFVLVGALVQAVFAAVILSPPAPGNTQEQQQLAGFFCSSICSVPMILLGVVLYLSSRRLRRKTLEA